MGKDARINVFSGEAQSTAYLMDGCLLANVSSRSGRGSSPPRPTKTFCSPWLAFSAAPATRETSEWNRSESYSPGMPNLGRVSRG